MTIILGRRGDKEPYTCAICGRRATGGGYVSKPWGKADQPIAWVCEDADHLPSIDCIRAIRKVYDMAKKNLDIYEERAIERATRDAIDPLFATLLDALFEGGVRNLEDMDAESYAKIADAAAKSDKMREVMTGFLKGFGNSIREQIGSGEAPF
jgi:hypothetical protein